MILNISQDPIPADVIVSYFHKYKEIPSTCIVKIKSRRDFVHWFARIDSLGLRSLSYLVKGSPWWWLTVHHVKAEGTFRKHYHGLKTLHLHFHRKQVYEIRVLSHIHYTSSLICDNLYTIIFVQFNDETNNWEGNPCNDPTVQVMVKWYIIQKCLMIVIIAN